MAARPTITVWSDKGESSGSLPLPAVFTAPIRLDVVQQVHSESSIYICFGYWHRKEARRAAKGRETRGSRGGRWDWLEGCSSAAIGGMRGGRTVLTLHRVDG